MKAILWGALAVLPLAGPDPAGDEILPADRRFAPAAVEEIPSFQRHVVPLLGRLGCNGRSCHGSFQGQGGFRLSLFGYDFKSDHEALAGGKDPRADAKNPKDSLVLLKPTRSVDHKGGKRLEAGSWQYRLLLRWVQAGAPAVKESDATFHTLEIEPKEIVFGKAGEAAPLKVVARWSDGTREDVTPLCRFRSNDESVATVDPSGRVTAAGKGDTHVVAFYDNGVAPVQVILPASDRAAGPPEGPTTTRVDALVGAKLRKLGLLPSDLCTDAEFLRRLSLDLTGTLPAPNEILAFLADPAPNKRTRKIDELLERPAYAAWWATKLCDLTANSERTGPLGGEQGLNREKSRQWYLWIYRRVRENVAYDKLVEGVALAVGRRPEQSYDDYCAEMSAYFRKDKPSDFTARETMPYFWTRRTVGKPEDKALSFAHAFLGVSLQCAQCHKHPYDQWTKQDFDQFTAFFNGVRYGNAPRDRVQEMKKAVGLEGDEDSGAFKRKFSELLQQGKTLPFKELNVPTKPKLPLKKAGGSNPRLGRVITPKLLGGEEVIATNYDDPRRPVMDWMRQADNPYFATAFVNRAWAAYFNVGLIEPTDDLNLANPPSNPALLDYLSEGFVASGYDMKWLHREIASSRAYQRSRRANETNALDERNYSRAVIRRVPAEAACDAVLLATASDESRKALDRDPVAGRAIGMLANASDRRDGAAYSLSLFGKPPRAVNCDCERSNEPSLLQTVYLRNDAEVLKLIDRKDGWVQQVSRTKGHDLERLVREAYLRTLSRPPEDRERSIAVKHVSEAESATAGLRDLLWVLINTKEFIVNH